METRRVPFAFRLTPSFADLAFLAPFGLLLARGGMRSLLGDGDTGWHLRTGEWILARHAVPRTDLFSFSMPGSQWFAWEWLWDAIFALLHQAGGMAAVLLASALLLAVTFRLLYRATLRASGDPLIAVAVTLLALATSSIHWLARPHLITLLALVLFLAALERQRASASTQLGRVVWLLAPAMVLWTNLHGGFFTGLLLIGSYLAGDLLRALTAGCPETRLFHRRRAGSFGLLWLACLAATFVNPYTWRLHAHIVSYLRDPYQMKYIAEFQSVSFRHPLTLLFELLLALGVACAWQKLRKGDWTAAMILLSWAHLALVSGRNIAIFAILGAPFLAGSLREWADRAACLGLPDRLRALVARFHAASQGIREIEAIRRLPVLPAAALLLIALVLWAPAPPPGFQAAYDPAAYPERALAALPAELLRDRMFTTETWGGYLIYRLYPRLRVFVDGRSDFYGSSFGERYLDVLNVKPGWQENLDRYGIELILLPTDLQLTGALKESSRWKPIYDDGTAILFRSTGSRGAQASATNRVVENTAGGRPSIHQGREARFPI